MNNLMQPLAGLKFLITRPYQQALALIDTLQNYGGKAWSLPTIEINDATDQTSLAIGLQNIGHNDIAVFTSQHAVYKSATLITHFWPQLPEKLLLLAIGPATAIALKGITNHKILMPKQYDSEGLLNIPELQTVSGKTITIIKGEGGRTLLARDLALKRALVNEVVAYRRSLPEINRSVDWQKTGINLIISTSGESLQNLFTLFQATGTTWIQDTPIVVISQRMAEIASRLGVKSLCIANNPTDAEIIAAVLKWKEQEYGEASQ